MGVIEAIHGRDNEARTGLGLGEGAKREEPRDEPWALMMGWVWEMGKREMSRCH